MTNQKHIIIDSRERKYFHISSALQKKGYEYKINKLDAGDYSFYFNGKDYREEFVIERKASWVELYGNLVGKDRARIKREFRRLQSVKVVILLIEEPKGYEGIDFMKMNNYKMSRNRLRVAYKSFIEFRTYERANYPVEPLKIVFCDKTKTAEIILKLINDYLKTDLSQLSNV